MHGSKRIEGLIGLARGFFFTTDRGIKLISIFSRSLMTGTLPGQAKADNGRSSVRLDSRKRSDLSIFDAKGNLWLVGEVKLPGTPEGRHSFASSRIDDLAGLLRRWMLHGRQLPKAKSARAGRLTPAQTP